MGCHVDMRLESKTIVNRKQKEKERLVCQKDHGTRAWLRGGGMRVLGYRSGITGNHVTQVTVTSN
jgi:hypothetical protein